MMTRYWAVPGTITSTAAPATTSFMAIPSVVSVVNSSMSAMGLFTSPAGMGPPRNILFPDFYDPAPITRSILNDVAAADAGDDYLDGGSGNDKLFGGAGDDYLDGGMGNDSLYGEAGDDELIGGDGNDKLWGDLDNAAFNQDQQIAETHGTLSLFNREYSDGFDVAGDDILDGGNGDDELHGNDGNDTLQGGAGVDVLYGGEGADVLDGGEGNDTLVGGEGNDTYIYNLGDGQDDIFDHDATPGNFDTLQLAGIGAEGVRVEDINNDLVIAIAGTSDRITIHNWFAGDGANIIESIELADGSTLDVSAANLVRSYQDPSGALGAVITSLGGFRSWVGFHYPDSNALDYLGNVMQGLSLSRIPGPSGSLVIDSTYGNPFGELLGDLFDRSIGFNSLIPQDVANSFNGAQQFIRRRDPLTFDLDGDGIETVGIDPNNPILFDHDGDGLKTATGWVKADDAFLVLDRNGNGTIDNGTELFGDSTP